MAGITLLYDHEIDINLPLSGCHLIAGYTDRIGLPLEIFLRLYAVKDADITLIAEPGDLSRFVERIDGADAGWRFLHLFTSPETHYFFQKRIYTIDLTVAAPGSLAGTGMISPETARRVGYQPPSMNVKGDEYFAVRDLVSADPMDRTAPAKVLRRREALSVNGAYQFLEELIIGDIPRTDVPFPSYE